jgi:rhamnosyltransferase subunit B
MHFVCAPFGSSGDVHPMIGLALALKARGHRVTMVANGYFADLIRSRALDLVELGTRDEFLALSTRPELWNPYRAFQFLYREGVSRAMRPHFDILADFHGNGPLVSITNVFGFGARVAQEKLDIPLVMLHLQPSVIWSDIAPPRVAGVYGPRWLKRRMYSAGERFAIDRAVCPSLNQWRAELGLAPVRRITRWWHSPWCVACLFPDWFAAPQADWPPNLLQTSFPLWDERTDEPLSRELSEFLESGSPPIAFTPGSANLFGHSFFAAALDACRRLNRRGLLLTRFAEQLPAQLPATVKHITYAPFSQLLPRCGALVHHGGIGSMSQAMAAGVPQVIAAQAHDQFDNAQRVGRLGVGQSMLHRRVSGRRLAARLAPLLESTTVRDRCRELASRLARVDGLADMAVAIEGRLEDSVSRTRARQFPPSSIAAGKRG